MNVLIIEDEPLAAEKLSGLITACAPEANILGVVSSVEETVHWLNAHPAPDLLFSDIQIADGLSFEVFRQVEVTCPVIFTTAYDQYAIEAFEVNSIDYLLKPVKREKLAHSLEKFRQMRSNFATPPIQEQLDELMEMMKSGGKHFKTRFLVKQGTRIRPVKTEEIAYFYSRDKLTFLVDQQGKEFVVDHSLDEIVGLVNPTEFFRANRKFVISLEAAQEIHPYFKGRVKLMLSPPTKEEVIVSSERTPLFKTWLDQ
jgi:two-component system LytT family response regulator